MPEWDHATSATRLLRGQQMQRQLWLFVQSRSGKEWVGTAWIAWSCWLTRNGEASSGSAASRLERIMGNRIPELDVSARAGMLLAGFSSGRSNQPNLLTRSTADQALITGVTAASAYGIGVSGHSFLESIANRLPMNRVVSGLAVDAVVASAGLALMKALPPQPQRSGKQAALQLMAHAATGVGTAGLAANALESIRGRRGARTAATAALAGVVIGSWALTRPGRAKFGSRQADGSYLENTPKTLSTGKAAVFGLAATGALYGLSHAESAGATGISHVAAKLLGGEPADHRSLGRIGVTLLSAGGAWYAVAAVSSKLATVGQDVEAANEDRPTLPEITGSPASGIPWDIQSREGTRWLSATLTASQIEAVMEEPSKQPIRVYASLESADSEEERAELLLSELDRTRAFERSYIALFSPTGSGYVNYVATESYEFLTRGDCASAAIQYSVLPSPLSLTRTEEGTRQTRLVLDGIAERLRELPPSKRPKVFLFGESLGCKVNQEVFTGASDQSLRALGIDGALWVGTPSFTNWRQVVWEDRPQNERPEVGPGAIYSPRAVPDWRDLPDSERERVRYLLLQNGADPVPKFDAQLLWREPNWLGPDESRPPGAPQGTKWQPVTTFVTTLVDQINALAPTPGQFEYGGHDYRSVIPDAIADVWRLPATAQQRQRIFQVMEDRELASEIKRLMAEAEAKPEAERAEAMAKAKAKVAEIEAKQT